jgi:hypothetical protein
LLAIGMAAAGCRGPGTHLAHLPKGFMPDEPAPPIIAPKQEPAAVPAIARAQEIALPAVETQTAPIPRAQSRKPVQEIEPKRAAVRLVGIRPTTEPDSAAKPDADWSPDVDDWASPRGKSKPAAESTDGAARRRNVPADRGE